MTTVSQQTRRLHGKVVRKILLDRFWDSERGRWYYDPTIFFTDGSSISFVVEETDTGRYGISPVVIIAGEKYELPGRE